MFSVHVDGTAALTRAMARVSLHYPSHASIAHVACAHSTERGDTCVGIQARWLGGSVARWLGFSVARWLGAHPTACTLGSSFAVREVVSARCYFIFERCDRCAVLCRAVPCFYVSEGHCYLSI